VRIDSSNGLADEDIVSRVIAGETALFELIVRRYNQRLYRAAKAILKDEAEAEDVMQEAYVRAFEKLDQFAGNAKFSTWLTKIAVYEALARLRKRHREGDMPEIINSGDSPERITYDVEIRRAIEDAVETLPPLYRSVFVLRDVEEMSGAETAECLGITEETVKTRLHRARNLLRHQLERAVGSAVGSAFSYGERRCDAMTESVMSRIQRHVGAGQARPPIH
jgi:RNA polymerase sigma-70 factor (ECF subfamily)